MRRLLLILRHAFRSALRQRRRTATAAGSIAFGVVALVLSGSFFEWIFWATREGTIQNGLGHIHVALAGFRQSGSADLDKFRLPDRSDLLDSLRRDPAVRTVAPRMSFSGLVSHGDTTLSFIGEGVDPVAESRFGEAPFITDGEMLSDSEARGIVVGYGLAANLGAKVGDTVVLLATIRGGSINAVEARIRGLFATPNKAYDDSAMRVPLVLANELTRAPGAHRWVIVLKETSQTRTVLDRLRTANRASGFEFVPWYELADFYNKTHELLSRQMNVMAMIIAVIIVLTISNSMTMSVMERTSEIGTAMALGTRRVSVLVQFVCEGLALGLAGGIAGILGGIGLAALISAIGIPMPPPPGQAREFTAEMIVTGPVVARSFALAVVTALLAALYPAWIATRTPIVEALRRGR